MTATNTSRLRLQTFALTVGDTYHVSPPATRRPGVVYLSGICRLLAVYADGRARFESPRGETFTIPLSDNRIRLY